MMLFLPRSYCDIKEKKDPEKFEVKFDFTSVSSKVQGPISAE